MIYRNHLVLEKLLHLQARENYYGDLNCDPPKFSGASQVVLVVKKPPAKCRHKRCRFNPWVRKIPWREAWQTTPVFLPGESHGQRSLVGYRT